MDRQQIGQRVREVLELVSLSEKAKAFPDQLGGGTAAARHHRPRDRQSSQGADRG